MFILSSQRDQDVNGSFERYEKYLQENREHFPESAFAIATSDWYYNSELSGCPHDAWLENFCVSEPSSGERNEVRAVELRIELLGAYHDGIIVLSYPKVFRYVFEGVELDRGHNDWRFDEFRLNDEGHLIHEIEWCGWQSTGRWIIEATDVEYRWSPYLSGTPHNNKPPR